MHRRAPLAGCLPFTPNFYPLHPSCAQQIIDVFCTVLLVNATISAIESLNDPRSLVPFAAVSYSLLTLDTSDDDPMPVVIHISYGSIFNATFTCGHARKKSAEIGDRRSAACRLTNLRSVCLALLPLASAVAVHLVSRR